MSQWKFEEKIKAIERVKKTLPTILGNMALNHFIKSFDDSGFTDYTLNKWRPRKRQGRGKKGRVKSVGSRALLVKSGRLKRSIKLKNKTFSLIKISSSLPYSEIHNEGLMGKAWGKHSFKMPKRQFIGDSEKLRKQILNEIEKTFNSIL